MTTRDRARRLLIVGGGVEQIRAYELAHEMGVEVVGSDWDPDAPALALADHVLIASTRDVAETVSAAERFHATRPLDGVMTIANDVPRTVAAVAARLGLPGISEASAALAADKLAMKRAFAEADVRTAPGRPVRTLEELETAVRELGRPLVLKPIDGRGARGVLQLTEDAPNADLAWAFAEAMRYSERGVSLVERFIPGMQLSTEGFVVDGVTYTAAASERNYEYMERLAPNIIENGGTIPAPIDAPTRAAVDALMTDAARALGIENGPVKGDLVLGPDGPTVIELAARLSGGYFCTDQIPLATGVDLVAATIRWSLGERIAPKSLRPTRQRATAIRYLFPPAGRIVAIRGFDELDAPWVRRKHLFLRAGDVVEPMTDHTRRAGFVLVDGETRAEALARVASAIGAIELEIKPDTGSLMTGQSQEMTS